MRKYTAGFKQEAVKKALSRSASTTIRMIATDIGIGYSTLHKWILDAKQHELEPMAQSTTEKRPQDWTREERLDMIIKCAAMNDEEMSACCRQSGIYLHHLKQWRSDFIADPGAAKTSVNADTKPLKREIKKLQQDLRRKEKALSETAALLVLSKKLEAIWDENADA